MTRGWLGIEPQPMTRRAGQALALEPRGRRADPRLQRNGPAERAGMQARDVVLEIGGKPTHDVPQLLARIAELPPGSSAKLQAVARGKPSRST